MRINRSRVQRVMRYTSGRAASSLCGIACILLFAVCAVAPKETAVMRSAGAAGMTASELQLRLHDFALRYSGKIEEAALSIARDSIDDTVERNLLRWQLYGIPAYFKTLFQPDPYVALADSWVLTLQAIEYYKAGPGKDDFGAHQDRVISTYEEFEVELRGLVRAARADSLPPEDVAEAVAWVDDHPIESYLFVRSSVLPVFADVMGGASGLGVAVASVESGMRDMSTRMTLLTEFIPKQVQWQLELASYELLGDLDADSALKDLLHVSDYIVEVDSLIARNLNSAFDAVDVQRMALLEAVAQERAAILTAIANERDALVSAVAAERLAALENIQQLVTTSLSDVRQTSGWTVDKAFRRALVLVAVIFVAAIIYRIVSGRLIGMERSA